MNANILREERKTLWRILNEGISGLLKIDKEDTEYAFIMKIPKKDRIGCEVRLEHISDCIKVLYEIQGFQVEDDRYNRFLIKGEKTYHIELSQNERYNIVSMR